MFLSYYKHPCYVTNLEKTLFELHNCFDARRTVLCQRFECTSAHTRVQFSSRNLKSKFEIYWKKIFSTLVLCATCTATVIVFSCFSFQMADVVMVVQCIRCGSRDHTTREHDEGKVVGGVKASKNQAKTIKQTELHHDRPQSKQVQHDHCWKGTARQTGIPDVIDKPFRERFYHDPPRANWLEREPCSCKECEKKKKKKDIELSKRTANAKR